MIALSCLRLLACDSRTLSNGETLGLRFDLTPTPVKRRDPRHWKWRYLMGCGGW